MGNRFDRVFRQLFNLLNHDMLADSMRYGDEETSHSMIRSKNSGYDTIK